MIQYKRRVINANFICFQVKIVICYVILCRKFTYASPNQIARSHAALQKSPFTLNLYDVMNKPVRGTPEDTNKEKWRHLLWNMFTAANYVFPPICYYPNKSKANWLSKTGFPFAQLVNVSILEIVLRHWDFVLALALHKILWSHILMY
jgi:hypothetical protein